MDTSLLLTEGYHTFDEAFIAYTQSVDAFLDFLQSAHRQELEYIQQYQDRVSVFENNRQLMLLDRENIFSGHLSGLTDKKAKLLGEIGRYQLIFDEGNTQFGKITPEISMRINGLKQAVEDLIHMDIDKSHAQYAADLKDLNEKLTMARSKIENDFYILKQDLSSKVTLAFENWCEKEMGFFNQFPATADEEKLNDTISVFSNKQFSPYVQIGSVQVKDSFFDEFSFSKKLKVITPFIDMKSILIIHDDQTSRQAENIHDMLVSRGLLSSDVGNIRINFCDLKGMGEFFREFRPITHQVVRIGYGRAFYEEIIKKTDENNIQIANSYTASSMHSDFSSLGAYNYDKVIHQNEESFIPHYINILLNLSYDADESSVKKLKQTLENGTKNGTQFVITWNKDDETDQSGKILEMLVRTRSLQTIDLTGNYSGYFLKELELHTQNLPESRKHELVYSFNEEFKEKSQQVSKVHFKDILPEKHLWFSLRSHEAIQVPIGKSKIHRGEQTIDIKTHDFQAHVLMSGGNGSGKTNFMKTFITSAALQYSPDELEFYLVDLKAGVGFDIFRKMQLPHVKMYAMGAENELIYNILDRLNNEMNRRLNLFRDNGVEDIHAFRTLCPEEKMPRTVLIIDEFSTLFEQDNPLQDEICARITPLAKKARATGINMFFSTQNFNSVSHSFNKSAKSEFPIRIVLKSSFDAAAALLDTRNDGMKNVSTVGDGLVNYRIGNKLREEDNEFFKAYLLENKDLKGILTELREESERRGYERNEQWVYDNTLEADFSANAEIFLQQRYEENAPVRIKKIPLWLGEPTTISTTHFKIELEKNFHENIIISGIDRSSTIHSVYSILSSLSYAFAAGEIAIRVISFLSEEENEDIKLNKLNSLQGLFDFEYCAAEHYQDSFDQLYREFKWRYTGNNGKGKRIFLVLIGLEKAGAFFKEDSYTLSDAGSRLFEIIENGPGVMIHTIAEIRQPGYLDKLFKSNSINLFKHRIVFHLNSADESMNILDSRMASSLYKQDEPYTKNRAVYYNADYEKTYSKFKPYQNLIDSDLFMADTHLQGSFEKNVFFTSGPAKPENEETEIPDFSAEMIPESENENKTAENQAADPEEETSALDRIHQLQIRLNSLGESEDCIEISELQ